MFEGDDLLPPEQTEAGSKKKRVWRPMTPEQADTMIEAYLNGMPSREAAALFGYTKKALLDLLQRRGIPPRDFSAARKLFYANHPDLTYSRTYAVDDTFFDQIDTEEKAYWLGFFTADGNVNHDNNAVRLSLNIGDEAHVVKFQKALQSEQPLYYTEVTKSVGIEIGSKRLVKALYRLGITANKSLTVKPCPDVPQELQRHYWRGLVDGDGHIGRVGTSKNAWAISLSGTLDVVEGFRQFLSSFTFSKNKVNFGHGNYQISYTYRKAISACDVLYKDATIYLDRKYKSAYQACDWEGTTQSRLF